MLQRSSYWDEKLPSTVPRAVSDGNGDDDEYRVLVEKSAALLELLHRRKYGNQKHRASSALHNEVADKGCELLCTVDSPRSAAASATAVPAANHTADDERLFNDSVTLGEDASESVCKPLSCFLTGGLMDGAVSSGTPIEQIERASEVFISLPVEQQKLVLSSRLCELYTLLHVFFS